MSIGDIHHFFIPHHTNNHRPRILHPTPLLMIITFVFLLQVAFRLIHQSRPDILGFATNITIDELYINTNKQREQNGQPSVHLNPTLSAAAAKKAQHMFSNNYWAHMSPDGTSPWEFILGEGYQYSFAGENLARDFDYSKDVVDAWMASPSHRENLLRGEYEDIGFAIVNGTLNGRETTLVVQMFGTTNRKATAARTTVPSPTIPVRAAATSAVVKAETFESVQSRLVRQPVFDLAILNRNIAFMLLGIFASVLVVDGFMIWKHRTVRIAGHNFAHFIFLLAIIGVAALGASGAILAEQSTLNNQHTTNTLISIASFIK
ncbi:MAG TPA: CAP domain-containing protein [Patescibacteria group bacterium]|nr:CAP domain-containing protein [Patescibacteria group bacterium]